MWWEEVTWDDFSPGEAVSSVLPIYVVHLPTHTLCSHILGAKDVVVNKKRKVTKLTDCIL